MLLRVEGHWTSQVQSQQERLTALTTIIGTLLGFLVGAGFLTDVLRSRQWPSYFYLLALLGLTWSVVLGVGGLLPRIRVGGPSLWLDSARIREGARSKSEVDLMEALCDDAAESAHRANIPRVLLDRRRLIFMQMLTFLISLMLLTVALIGFPFSHPARARPATQHHPTPTITSPSSAS